tara:strand:- start:8389 stop:9729 length:1341 start_codon:yes stop_codon:yes gene_type:complete
MRFFLLLFIPIIQLAQSNNLYFLDQWNTDTLPICYDNESIFNEVWGFSFNKRDYAVLGSTIGAHFFEVVDERLVYLGTVEGSFNGRSAVHRDYHDFNGFLYAVCDEGPSSLQIMDLHHLPDSIPLIYDSDSLLVRAHNIFIDTAMKKLYACAVTTKSQFHAMNVYDIENPIEPKLLYNYNQANHVHDAYVYNDTAYLNCGNEGLKVIKSSSNFPIQIGDLGTYLQKGYNHSGWLNESKNTYIMCDETYGLDVKALNVSQIEDLEVASFFNSEMGDKENSVAHNVIVRGDIAFISYYHDGLQIFDISESNHVKKIAHFDTYLDSPNVSWAGAWGVYPFPKKNLVLVSDRLNGLFLLKFIPPPLVDNNPSYVFPNPSNDFVYFYKEHFGNADYNLNLFDMSGKLLNTFHSNSDYTKIENLSTYKSGFYILNYSSNLEPTLIRLKFFIQ